MQHQFTNRLIQETSPYLLQHAHNPVDWFAWGEEALEKSKKESKPILVSIGYSACHWCHVMERESFEDEGTAAIMNENFVNIKIDREERPDLDHIYMDAVQAISGSGGWPLNVFLTPEGKPFFGGTYFPPIRAFNRPSWKEILVSVSKAYQEKKEEIELQAEQLTNHLMQSNQFGIRPPSPEAAVFNQDTLQEIYSNLMKSADKNEGGFGAAPKFPQTFSIQYLLRHYYFTKDQEALDQAKLSLDKMIRGGIYDQLGGGFARYSTDAAWIAPHFEKMLYDNALLVTTISEAYQLTKLPIYMEAITETIDFIERELMDPDGGFYSALDADSEGEEGKFYVWDLEEIQEVLGKDADLFAAYYDVTVQGNWEGKNILRVLVSAETFAAERKMELGELKELLQTSRQKLFAARSKRARPLLDDKMLLGWNALMNAAASKAFMATGDEKYNELAQRNMKFMLASFRDPDSGEWRHSYKNGKRKSPAFLDDYAYLIQALILLQEITGDPNHLIKAKELTEYVITHFSEEETGFFFYTHQLQKDVIVRKKEIYDGAIPSGNAVMANNLNYLGIVFDRKDFRARSMRMIMGLEQVIRKYPTSFGVWASLLQAFTESVPEIVLTGIKINGWRKHFLSIFIAHKIFQSSEIPNQLFPLLEGKPVEDHPLAFLCKDYQCLNPSNDLESFIRHLRTV